METKSKEQQGAQTGKVFYLFWDVCVVGILLTRFPFPKIPDQMFDRSGRAVWAYPIIGSAVALIASIPLLGAFYVGLPTTLGVLMFMTANVLATGAMHDDGLADCADGFWGGYCVERRLAIMRDSRIGTYGILALILVSLAEFSVLLEIIHAQHQIILIVISAASLSRAMLAVMLALGPFARQDGLARSLGDIPAISAIAALVIATSFNLVFYGLVLGIIMVLANLFVLFALRKLCISKIAGINGDTLGAVQKLTWLLSLTIALASGSF